MKRHSLKNNHRTLTEHSCSLCLLQLTKKTTNQLILHTLSNKYYAPHNEANHHTRIQQLVHNPHFKRSLPFAEIEAKEPKEMLLNYNSFQNIRQIIQTVILYRTARNYYGWPQFGKELHQLTLRNYLLKKKINDSAQKVKHLMKSSTTTPSKYQLVQKHYDQNILKDVESQQTTPASNSNTPSLLDLKKITQHIELMIQSMENLSNLKESSLQPKKKPQKQNKFLKISPPQAISPIKKQGLKSIKKNQLAFKSQESYGLNPLPQKNKNKKLHKLSLRTHQTPSFLSPQPHQLNPEPQSQYRTNERKAVGKNNNRYFLNTCSIRQPKPHPISPGNNRSATFRLSHSISKRSCRSSKKQ